MANRRKKKAARRGSKSGRRISAKSARRVKKKTAKRTAKRHNRKHRVMHCPAATDSMTGVSRLPEHDAEGGTILTEHESICGNKKTKGPRYSYLCEKHKGLSPAAQKAGLLNGSTPAPAAEAPAVVEGAGVAVEMPPVETPSTPEDKAEIASEIEAAKEADDIPALAALAAVAAETPVPVPAAPVVETPVETPVPAVIETPVPPAPSEEPAEEPATPPAAVIETNGAAEPVTEPDPFSTPSITTPSETPPIQQ